MHSFRLPESKIDVEYPQYLDLEDGRPAVFSANGSHGTWTQPGEYCHKTSAPRTHKRVIVTHIDATDQRKIVER